MVQIHRLNVSLSQGCRGQITPKTEEGWEELGKRVATAHANYVIEKIERLNCPTWQKLELYQAVIDTTKGTYEAQGTTRLAPTNPQGKKQEEDFSSAR